MTKISHTFWVHKQMTEMTTEEWESLCDNCGVCCLEKLEDEDGNIYYTSVACKYLDSQSCTCRVYHRRSVAAPTCLKITPYNIYQLSWLPDTCAYMKVFKRERLEWWHHLISGDRETVHDAGISIRGKSISGQYIHPDDIEAYLL